LEEIFKTNREDFEKKWDDIKVFIEYGMISDEKFYERAEKFCLFKNTDGKYFTFEEYKKHIVDTQTDKTNSWFTFMPIMPKNNTPTSKQPKTWI